MKTKKQYIEAITNLLEKCEDIQLIDFIYKLLDRTK